MRPGIGIIGTGMVGQMCHLANFAANPACRVVAIGDLRPDLAAAAAQKFGIPGFTARIASCSQTARYPPSSS